MAPRNTPRNGRFIEREANRFAGGAFPYRVLYIDYRLQQSQKREIFFQEAY
jgi:hypothetical protein